MEMGTLMLRPHFVTFVKLVMNSNTTNFILGSTKSILAIGGGEHIKIKDQNLALIISPEFRHEILEVNGTG